MSITPILVEFLLLQAVTPLEDFILENFHKKAIVLMSSNFSGLDDRLIFMLNLLQPKVIINPKYSPNLENFNNYIISEKNLTSLSHTIDLIEYKIKTQGRFLVILQGDSSEDETKTIFETFWSHYIYNVVVYTNWTSFITWYPYRSENCCGTLFNLVKNVKYPYNNKIPKHLNGCPINVTWSQLALGIKNPFNKQDPGYSIRVMDTIGEKMIANVVYLTENVDYMASGLKKYPAWRNDMIQRSIDVGFIFKDVPEPIGSEFKLGIPYFETYVFFVLPPRRKITSSTNTLVIFSLEVWAPIVVSVLFMVVLLKYLKKTSLQWCFFEVFRFMLQSPLKYIPTSTTNRIIFCFFFFYSCNLNWIYISQLSGVLSKPSYEPKLSTLQELALSNKKLRFTNFWDKFIVGTRYEKEIFEKKIHVPDSENSFNDQITTFVKNLDHGFVNSNTRMHYIKNPQKLHIVSHFKITTLYSHLMFRKAFPLLEKVDDVILHIIEAGLMSKWFYESQLTVQKFSIPDYEDVEGHLDLDGIFFVFVLLGAGFSISLFVFILELLVSKKFSLKRIQY